MTSSDSTIRLRALEPEDLELIYRIENDTAFWQYGTTTVPYSRYAIRQYLQNAQNDLFADRQVRLVIEKQPHLAIGFADLCNFDPVHQRAEVSLAVLPEYQGQHIGFKAMQQLCDYARALPALHQIYAIIATTNQPATHLFQRLQFTPAATLREWLLHDDGGFTDAVLWQKKLDQRH